MAADASAAPSRARCRVAPSRSSGSASRAPLNAATAPARSPVFSRSSPSANQAEAKPGASSTVCARTWIAAATSRRLSSSRAISKRRSAVRSPEDRNSCRTAIVGMLRTRNPHDMAYLSAMRPEDLLRPMPSGLCCPMAEFHIDPTRPVAKALITHGHSDHARPGHGAVLATQETLDFMRLRYGDDFAGSTQAVRYGETLEVGGVAVSFHPAGHVLGSAQIRLARNGLTIVASGDYKDVEDPTCTPFKLVPCDLFVTEATFGLPVFHHPDPKAEIAKLLRSVALFPDRPHLVGAYSLGKTQRAIALLRK